ncbi:MAG: phage integrase SAM-like domain-containing protein [Cyclobacteriaceae bacterium]|nr:phage integrase SAM-like domain-containing protein [Cyclobacteriaceae bacterium]
MPSVKAIVRENKVNSKGESVVYVRYGHQQRSVDITTGVMVAPRYWRSDKQLINSVSGVRKTKLNEELLKQNEKSDLYANTIIDKVKSQLISIARSLIQEDVEPEVHLVKERYLESKKPKTTNHSTDRVEYLFNQFIETSNKSINTVKNYRTALYHLKEYEKYKGKPLTLKMLDMSFYDDFAKFLVQDIIKLDGTKGLADNSVASTIKNLKVFLTYLEKRGYNFQELTSNLKVSYQDKPIYFLTEDEITTLYNYEFESDRLIRARDLFVLNCYLGLRYSDLSRLKRDHIKDGDIDLRALKNQKDVYVPITPVAQKILEKYDYEIPMISEQNLNQYIKEACQIAGIDKKVEIISTNSGNKIYDLVPKWQVMSTHIAVKTFITLFAKKGVSPKVIAAITGKTVKVIWKHYYGIDKDQIREQVVKAFW